MRYHVTVEGREEPIVVEILADDGRTARVRFDDGEARTFDISALSDRRVLVGRGGGVEVLHVLGDGGRFELLRGNAPVHVTVKDERDTWLGTGAGAGETGTVTVAMPGKVVTVDVEAGQAVEAGQRLLVIEAMKMENPVSCPRDAVIAAVNVKPGDAVEAGQALVELE